MLRFDNLFCHQNWCFKGYYLKFVNKKSVRLYRLTKFIFKSPKKVSIINKEEYWQQINNISDERTKTNQPLHQNQSFGEPTEALPDRREANQENASKTDSHDSFIHREFCYIKIKAQWELIRIWWGDSVYVELRWIR